MAAKRTVKAFRVSIANHLEEIDRGMTTTELAALLKISRRSLYDMAKAGRIPSFSVGSHVRFDPHTVAETALNT